MRRLNFSNLKVSKVMCFYPHKGVPKAVVEALCVYEKGKWIACGYTKMEPMNGGMEPMPRFLVDYVHPMFFSEKTRVMAPSQAKKGIPRWRIDPVFRIETHKRASYWNLRDAMESLGDISHLQEAENERSGH